MKSQLYQPNSKHEWTSSPAGLIVPVNSLPESKPKLKAFDFFAGCGGWSVGLHQAGFHVVGALELSFDAAQTYMVNLGNFPCQIHFDNDQRKDDFEKYLSKQIEKTIKKTGIASIDQTGSGWISHYKDCHCSEGHHQGVGYDGKENKYLKETGFNARPAHAHGCEHFWIADIYNMTGAMILSWLEMERGELDLVVGSPPCQGMSQAGKMDETDPRNDLTFEYGRLITELNPKSIAMENVPQLVSMKSPEGIGILDGFCKILADGDYAPFESLRRSLIGRSGVKAILRAEKKEKIKKKEKKVKEKPKVPTKPNLPVQASLF